MRVGIGTACFNKELLIISVCPDSSVKHAVPLSEELCYFFGQLDQLSEVKLCLFVCLFDLFFHGSRRLKLPVPHFIINANQRIEEKYMNHLTCIRYINFQ